MAIGKILSNDKFATFAKGAGGAVITMTVIKLVGRPAFTLIDKNTTSEKKKYSATNEGLYQLICLGLALSFIPLFKGLGFKVAETYIKNNPKAKNILEVVEKQLANKEVILDENNKKVKGKFKLFKHMSADILKKYNESKKVLTSSDKTPEEIKQAKKIVKKLEPTAIAINKALGGAELGSLVGSIIGLTIIAPGLGHQILHPIMHALGFNNKNENKIGQPNEIFLADAKVPVDDKKASKLHASA